jgi:hypothetical protein
MIDPAEAGAAEGRVFEGPGRPRPHYFRDATACYIRSLDGPRENCRSISRLGHGILRFQGRASRVAEWCAIRPQAIRLAIVGAQ